MKRSIRPSVPSDAPAIVALFAELGLHPNVRAEHLEWKYWAPRSDWPGPRSYVLTSDEEVIAHAALIPGAILTPGHRSSTGHLIDWVARRGQGGAGVTLMKYIGRQVDSLLAFGGSTETLRILPHIGFRPAGTVTGYARPMFPLRILDGDVDLTWEILPRLGRNLTWKIMGPRLDSGAWHASRTFSGEEISRVGTCLPNVADGAAVLERTPELLRYQLDCTIAPTALYVMERSGRPGGYFMLAYVPGQVRIVDCWMTSEDPSDWRAMIGAAVAQARLDPQAAEVVLWASTSRQHAVIESCGFHARFNLPIQIRAAAGKSLGTAGLNVQMVDNDASYLHEETSAHWI